VSTSVPTSVADSKAVSVSRNTSIADSKATSVATATIIPTVSGIPGFLSPTVGASLRTANDKMADVSSLLDFVPTAGGGLNDDRAAFVNAQTGFATAFSVPAGSYRIASDLTLSAGVSMAPGAYLKPASGVTVTISGPFSAGLAQCFDLSAGGHIVFGRDSVSAVFPEWFGAANSALSSVNRAAIQNAILASLNMTSLADTNPAFNYAPVVFNALYPTDAAIYCPRYTVLRGAAGGKRFGISSTAAINILVLGRSIGENDWVDIDFRDFDLEGNTALTTQVGIKASFTGASGYVSPWNMENVKLLNIGGDAVDIVGADTQALIVYLHWRNVEVYNAQGRVWHSKVGNFNSARFDSCRFLNSANGFYAEDIGVNTASAQTVVFDTCAFESLGKQDGASDYAVGSFAFKSDMFTGHYRFQSCYFEGNGNRTGDTTGCAIDVRSPWMLTITDSLIKDANNLVKLTHGGQAKLEGNYIAAGSHNTAVLWLDQVQPGSDYSNLDLGKNRFDTVYADSQLVNVTNSSLTVVTGFRQTRNYLATPPRLRRTVLRDGSTIASDDGALAYTAAKRLLNNQDSATSIPVYTSGSNGVATIVKNTFNGRAVIVTDIGAIVADVLLAAGGALTLVAQVGTNVSTTKDTGSKVNIYHDAGLNAWVIQNKLASAIIASVRLEGIDSMSHADDGYYETQFA
jgi:hypothetical protein